MPTVQVTFGNGTTQNIETDDVPGLLQEIEGRSFIRREPGHLSRIVDVRVLDDAAYEENIRKLESSRPMFGRGLGRRWP